MPKKLTLSIIIVHYKATEELFDALTSLKNFKTDISFEVIVVDNDEEVVINKDIKRKFPWVIYVKSPGNVGFGTGNNIGAKYANGKYLFFLNPDTQVYPKTLDAIVSFLENNKQAGIVAPLLLDPNRKPYPLQGTTTLNPLAGAVALSFINKLFPTNPVSKKYWQLGWDNTKRKEVDVVPGTAFTISKKLYDKVGGFDEHFFLYFEEFDLCKRIRDLGYKLYIIPEGKVMHLWGRSTKHTKNINRIFINSRRYYFRKHYGLVSSWLVELFTSFNKEKLMLIIIVLLGIFIRSYRVTSLMPFIGDQGWFYLSARDIVLKHTIPLVGITSSHPWLHQGPIWTYFLAVVLALGRWNPVAGAYLSITIGLLSILAGYKLGKEMFSKKIGVITALLFATSPLVILNDRMPYHTTPIPLFTSLFIYSIYKWLKGNQWGLTSACFFLAVLYNFELATAVLWSIPLVIILFKSLRKELQFNLRTVITSLLAIGVPMIPMLIYDSQHGFPQTIKFTAWIGYKILRLFGFPDIHAAHEKFNFLQFLHFSALGYQRLIYAGNGLISLLLAVLTITAFFFILFKKIKTKTNETNWLLLGLLVSITLVGYFAEKTQSEAYLPMLFPGLILLTAVSLTELFKKAPRLVLPILLVMLSGMNIYTIIQNNFFLYQGGYGFPLSERIDAAKQAIKLSQGTSYNLKGDGPGSQFESFTMNYEYLVWYFGHPPIKAPQKIKIVISENRGKIVVKNEDWSKNSR